MASLANKTGQPTSYFFFLFFSLLKGLLPNVKWESAIGIAKCSICGVFTSHWSSPCRCQWRTQIDHKSQGCYGNRVKSSNQEPKSNNITAARICSIQLQSNLQSIRLPPLVSLSTDKQWAQRLPDQFIA
ncbi:hypothetical protein V8F06_006827 [Rhypophila decipiens]